MKILLLSCSTGEGHNHCALAVKEALDARGHETSFLDMLHMFGDPGPLSFDKILNRISTNYPNIPKIYHAAGRVRHDVPRRRDVQRDRRHIAGLHGQHPPRAAAQRLHP